MKAVVHMIAPRFSLKGKFSFTVSKCNRISQAKEGYRH